MQQVLKLKKTLFIFTSNMAKKKKTIVQQEEKEYVPRKIQYYIFVGEKYYRRLQPTPYTHIEQKIKEQLGL